MYEYKATVIKDKYGRYLAEVYLEDLNINDYLLTNEYAVSYLK